MSDIISLEELKENFELFDNWEDRYRYLIDLGRKLPAMDESLKTDSSEVRGCVSKVWMVAGIEKGRFSLVADSDAHIVRGLIAVLMIAFNGRKIEEVRDLDIAETFRSLGLEQHLSPNRRSGFYSMVEAIRSAAGCPHGG